MTTDPTQFLRNYPSSDEVVHAFDHLLAVLQAEEDMDKAEHPPADAPPASPARIAELRHRLRQAAQGARVQLAMMRGKPAPTGPVPMHPPGSSHPGSKHG